MISPPCVAIQEKTFYKKGVDVFIVSASCVSAMTMASAPSTGHAGKGGAVLLTCSSWEVPASTWWIVEMIRRYISQPITDIETLLLRYYTRQVIGQDWTLFFNPVDGTFGTRLGLLWHYLTVRLVNCSWFSAKLTQIQWTNMETHRSTTPASGAKTKWQRYSNINHKHFLLHNRCVCAYACACLCVCVNSSIAEAFWYQH